MVFDLLTISGAVVAVLFVVVMVLVAKECALKH